MLRRAFLVLAFFLLSIGSSAFAEDSLKDIIQAREDAWSAAFNANDAAGVAAFYVEDGKLIPPGGEPIVGRTAIEAALPAFFPLIKDLKLVVDEVRPLGENYAVEVGHTEYSAVGEDGSLTPSIDNYVVVWHKGDDGVWRYMTDIFNAR